ncbi:MAG: 3-dehydroquinate synthase II family protein [Deltaproteobacteria bacterium]|nr:3-dehydroquinate synthase II family protein [Deltaproteobacteria bacterium]
MSKLYFASVPFVKEQVTLALESGVDGLVVPREQVRLAQGLARCEVLACEDLSPVTLAAKSDEEEAARRLKAGETVLLSRGWEVIPVENLLAQGDNPLAQSGALLAEAANPDEAHLACGILERGVTGVVILPEAAKAIKEIVAQCKLAQTREPLQAATITRVQSVGLGHRVCVDTLSLMQRGQGMLVGNSSAFTFLVHAETEHNEYVAARPFRINAGGVHAYTRLPGDRTCYLGELAAGQEVLILSSDGDAHTAVVGRVKIEVRPMLMIEAQIATDEGVKSGTVFLQNAETIRLTAPDGRPLSVVTLEPGDQVLCRTDQAGRHFGMRIAEDIREV